MLRFISTRGVEKCKLYIVYNSDLTRREQAQSKYFSGEVLVKCFIRDRGIKRL